MAIRTASTVLKHAVSKFIREFCHQQPVLEPRHTTATVRASYNIRHRQYWLDAMVTKVSYLVLCDDDAGKLRVSSTSDSEKCDTEYSYATRTTYNASGLPS